MDAVSVQVSLIRDQSLTESHDDTNILHEAVGNSRYYMDFKHKLSLLTSPSRRDELK